MTPDETKWLAEHNRREARKRIKGLYRALLFWGVFAIVWLVILFSEPDKKFSLTDSLFLMTIVINGFYAVRELIRNKRIVAGNNPAETGDNDNTVE